MTGPSPRSILAPLALAAAALAPGVSANVAPEAFFERVAANEVLDALYQECHEAGMSIEALSDEIIVCSAPLGGDELLGGTAIINVHEGHLRHRIRFALAGRAGGVQVWAYPWIEVEEPDGRLLEEDILSEEYLRRVQDVLARLGERLSRGDAGMHEPWAEHYDALDEWRLDAHLHAVAHCDRTYADLTAEELDRQLQAAGIRPRGRSLRDRCEELYEEIYAWGLARGVEEPGVEDYLSHLAALPPVERRCRGRLALVVDCP